jgi:hypothetical protein
MSFNINQRPHVLLVAALASAVTAALVAALPAASAGGDYGPDTCLNGYVWRGAVPNDHVCVTPARRDTTAQENAEASLHRNPAGGAYGPDTCLDGYVWREAVPNDHVCVLLASGSRDAARQDNAAAASRRDDIRVAIRTWNDNGATRYRVLVDRINTGRAYVKLYRTDGGTPSLVIGKWVTAIANAAGPGGWLTYNSQQLQCDGSSPNAYFSVYDGSSQRWSSRAPVRVGCVLID